MIDKKGFAGGDAAHVGFGRMLCPRCHDSVYRARNAYDPVWEDLSGIIIDERHGKFEG